MLRFYNPYDDVHEDMHPFIDNWAKLNERPLHLLTAQEVRAKLDGFHSGKHERPDTVTVRDIEAPLKGRTLDMRLYTPRDAQGPQPLLIYFHGGGWTIGTLDTLDRVLCYLCEQSGVSVVTVDYRLAPEHKYPAQIDDAYDAAVWIFENAQRLGFDPARIGIGGNSAGGTLAAATAILARDRGGPDFVFQLLIYPALDTNFDRPSWWRYRDGPLLTRDWMLWCWKNWQQSDEPVKDPIACPLQNPDLSRLPPTHMALAEIDVLHDEGVAYAHRLLDSGVAVRLQVCKRLPHGFTRAVFISDYVRNEFAIMAAAMKKGFGG
ncbi:MAG: alpha/beta hydrolase [Pseudorhodoplanes sp.]